MHFCSDPEQTCGCRALKRKITLPDGKAMIRDFKAGDVFWSDAQTHIGENVGEVPTHVLMIEMK
jgi:hypothetical protein